jgi:hypothetical protein
VFEGAIKIMNVCDLLISSVDLLISSIDFSRFTIPASLGGFSIIWYLAMFAVSDYLNLSAKQKLILSATSVICVFGGSWLVSIT